MASAQLIKTKASSLAKVAALPRHQHPADLLNELTLPFKLQRQMINAQVAQQSAPYYSSPHFQLASSLANSRLKYRQGTGEQRRNIADEEFKQWDQYLSTSMEDPKVKLSTQHKEKIYEAMRAAKERQEQRLALCRFVKFGHDYSAGFHVDFPLNPVIIMRLVHPHFGYLNLFPNQARYKLTHQQLFTFIEQLLVASLIRDQGLTLHSSEVLSFVLWKALTGNKSRVTKTEFAEGMKVFKFRHLEANNLQKTFSYSLPEGELLESDDAVRFETLRQIFLDRGL